MDPDFEAWFRNALDDAQREWPALAVEEADFRGYVEAKVAQLPDRATFRKLRTTDLYLAFACLQQNEIAQVEFEDLHFPKLERILAQMRIASSGDRGSSHRGRAREDLRRGEARPDHPNVCERARELWVTS